MNFSKNPCAIFKTLKPGGQINTYTHYSFMICNFNEAFLVFHGDKVPMKKMMFLKKEIVFKKKRNLYKNFTVWLQDGDILRKSMMYILLSWSSRWRRKKELLLSWILPQFTTKSQNLLHVISGELRKIGSSEQKIEMIFFAAPTGPNFLFFILLLNSVNFFS